MEPFTWRLPHRQFSWNKLVTGPKGALEVISAYYPLVYLHEKRRHYELVLGTQPGGDWDSIQFRCQLNAAFDILLAFSKDLVNNRLDYVFSVWFDDFLAPKLRFDQELTDKRVEMMRALDEGSDQIEKEDNERYTQAAK